jgi:hypothetical protein
MPVWDSGYLVFRILESANPAQPNVMLYDHAGEKTTEAHIWFSDASRVVLIDAHATPGAGILASGYADRTDGATAFFIAETSPDGRVGNVIRTNPFVPAQTCLAPDGTVWVRGHDRDAEDAQDDYMMLRQYSFAKGLLRAFLARKEFDRSIAFNKPDSFMVCGSSSALIYSGASHELLRVGTAQPGKTSLEHWAVDPGAIAGLRFTGFSVTRSGHVYASLERSTPNRRDLLGPVRIGARERLSEASAMVAGERNGRVLWSWWRGRRSIYPVWHGW